MIVKTSNACLIGLLSISQELIPKKFLSSYLAHTLNIMRTTYNFISLEGMMLKLKLRYFGHFMQRVDSLEQTLMLGGIGGRRRRGQ